MWIAAVIGAGIVVVVILFRSLQWHSDRTYRPSPEDVRELLEASIEGRLDLGAFDQFSCVRIAYDPWLDRIRERYNAIVNDEMYVVPGITESNATPLNERGRARVRELINELRGPQT
jgi:hypothetical protein